MTEDHCIDRVMWEVGEATRPTSPSEHRIIFDLVERKVVDAGNPFNETKVFLVSDSGDRASIAECHTDFLVTDFSTDRHVGIKITYQVSCERGNEDKVVESLCGDASPAVLLERLVKNWINDYVIGQESEFIQNYFAAKLELERHLWQSAREETGLNLVAVVSLNDEGLLEAVLLWPMVFPVSLVDHKNGQSLKVKAQLQLNTAFTTNALLYGSSIRALEEALMNTLIQYFAESVTLQQFCFKLSGDAFREGLIEILNRQLERVGYKVGFIMLEGTLAEEEISRSISELRHVISTFRVEILASDTDDVEPVIFTGDFQISALDLGGWYKFQSSDHSFDKIKDYLERSLQAELRKQTRSVRSYRDDSRFAEIEAAIVNLAKASVKTVFGLDIDLMNVQRLLTPLEIREKQVEQKQREATLSLRKERAELLRSVAQKLFSDAVKLEAKKINNRLEQIETLEQELLEDITLGRDQSEIEEKILIIEKVKALLLDSSEFSDPSRTLVQKALADPEQPDSLDRRNHLAEINQPDETSVDHPSKNVQRSGAMTIPSRSG